MTGCLLTQQAEESPIQRKLSSKTHNQPLSCLLREISHHSPLTALLVADRLKMSRARCRAQRPDQPTVDAQNPERPDVPCVGS